MALRLVRIDAQSLWFDEGYSWFAASQPTLVDAANADSTNPPLYYALLFVTVHMWGDNESALRLFSLFLSLPVIALAYQLARQVSPSARRRLSGLIAALIVALIPSMWWASQEARMYTLMALFVMIAALAWQHLITRARPVVWAWIALWLSELATLYTHNSGPVIVLWLNAASLLVWISRRSLRRPDVRLWIGGQIAVGLLWLPYFLTRFLNLSAANAAIHSAPVLTPEFALKVWQSFWIVPYERVAAGSWTVPVLSIAVFILALLLFVRSRSAVRWIFTHSVLLITGLIAALMVLGNEYHGRYVVMMAPLIAVGLGAGIGAIQRGWVRIPLTVGLAGACLFGIISTFDESLPFRHDDARAMVQYYADTLSENDSVIAWSYADRYELAYYWDRLGVRAHRITLPEGADLDQIAPLLPTSGDVSLNVWYTQRADYRGMMGCLLGDGTTALPDSFTTYGMTTYTYRQPPLQLPEVVPAGLVGFYDDAHPLAQLEFQGHPDSGTADQALCLPLALRLIAAPDVDLKALVLVKNTLGDTVATTDAIFATADQRTTASVEAGELVWAYPLVRLPAGSPSGDYAIYVRVYDEQGRYPTGLMQDSRSGIGHDAWVHTWTIEPGAVWSMPEDSQPIASTIASIRSLQLIGLDAPTEARPGDRVEVTLHWQNPGTALPYAPVVTLVNAESELRLPVEAQYSVGSGYSLDWRRVNLPPNMPPGEATLQLDDGTIIGRIAVLDVSFVSESPSFDHPVTPLLPEFEGYMSLAGYSAPDTLDISQSPFVTLIWQATQPTAIPYTVFVQVLNASGQVIAQSDSQPVNGDRPTTGWRQSEWIADDHTLTWNTLAAPGEGRLIAGLYDPVTGVRIPYANGQDFAELGAVTIR
ncbi:MAG: glycosyltransferase family 39 protein [Anaerolineae bacterium]